MGSDHDGRRRWVPVFTLAGEVNATGIVRKIVGGAGRRKARGHGERSRQIQIMKSGALGSIGAYN